MSRRRKALLAVLALAAATAAAWFWLRKPVLRLERARTLADASWQTVNIEPFKMTVRLPADFTCRTDSGHTRCMGGDSLSITWQVQLGGERFDRPSEPDRGENEDDDNREGGSGSRWLGDGVVLGFEGHWVFEGSGRTKAYTFYFVGYRDFPGRGIARLFINADGSIRDRDPLLGLAVALSTSAPAGTEPVWFPEAR